MADEVQKNKKARLTVGYADESGRFKLPTGVKTYSQQFSHVYNRRLDATKPTLRRLAEARWPGVEVVDRIVAASESGKKCVVLGTIFKEMEGRDNILDEYRMEYFFSGPAKPKSCYATAEDRCVLEDQSGRIKLVDGTVNVPVATLVTGLPFAASGVINDAGELLLEDWCGPGFPPPREAVKPEGNPRLLLLSGLSCGGTDSAPIALLCDWLSGSLSTREEDSEVVRCVARCIVAGGLLAADATAKTTTTTTLKSANGTTDPQLAPLHRADVCLARLAARVPTVVMPGLEDPSNVALPQQPIHPVLLPQSMRYAKTFTTAPNPSETVIGDRLVLGHSGQATSDVLKYTLYDENTRGAERRMQDGASFRQRHCDGGSDSALAALEDSLWWRHIAPTAPDSLASYPFVDCDPYVIEECPAVYFAGAQSDFATSLATNPDGSLAARIVCLPSFAETGVCALVDLTTLEVERLCFDTDALKPPEPILATPPTTTTMDEAE